jgi:hypothetical protein
MQPLKFGNSIFRSKGTQRSDPSADKTVRIAALDRLAGRQITLKEGDILPLSEGNRSLDWEATGGEIVVPISAITGVLEGRATIKAIELRKLSSNFVSPDTVDEAEFKLSLQAVVCQIQDLLDLSEAKKPEDPVYETPFTVIASEDDARLADRKRKRGEGQADGAVPIPGKQGAPEATERPIISLSALRSLAKERDQGTPGLENPLSIANQNQRDKVQAEQDVSKNGKEAEHPIPSDAAKASQRKIKVLKLPAPGVNQSGPGEESPQSNNRPEPDPVEAAASPAASSELRKLARGLNLVEPSVLDEDLTRQGMERLQDLFMTSQTLDGRTVAALVKDLPGVTGALIMLQGGVLLGGQLPESCNQEAALQAPELLKRFVDFVDAVLGSGTNFIAVSAATPLSLVVSGEIVLVVSHRSKKLPPGLARRLTETADALNLIYGREGKWTPPVIQQR